MTEPEPVAVSYLLLAKSDDGTVIPLKGAAKECTVDKLCSFVCKEVKDRYAIDHQSLDVYTTEHQEIYMDLKKKKKTVEDPTANLTAVMPADNLDSTKYYILEGSATPVESKKRPADNDSEEEKQASKKQKTTDAVNAIMFGKFELALVMHEIMAKTGANAGSPKRLSLEPMQFSPSTDVSADKFPGVLKFVGRHHESMHLMNTMQQGFALSANNDGDQSIKKFPIIVCGGASGQGKSTWARRAFDIIDHHYRCVCKSCRKITLSNDFVSAVRRSKNLRFRVVLEENDFDPSSVVKIDRRLGIRVLFEYLKHRCPQLTVVSLIARFDSSQITLRTVLEWIRLDCAIDGRAIIVVHLDEVNMISVTDNLFHTALRCLAAVGVVRCGCDVTLSVIVTSTDPVSAERYVLATGGKPATIPLPLLTQEQAGDVVQDLYQRCGGGDNLVLPSPFVLMLDFLGGHPRSVQHMLFFIGQQGQYFSPSRFVSELDKLLQPGRTPLDEGSRYTLILEYVSDSLRHSITSAAMARCAPFLLSLIGIALFEVSVSRYDKITVAGQSIHVLELERLNFVFYSVADVAESSVADAAESSVQQLVRSVSVVHSNDIIDVDAKNLKLALPLIWIQAYFRQYRHLYADHFISLLQDFSVSMSYQENEALFIHVLAFKCRFLSTHLDRAVRMSDLFPLRAEQQHLDHDIEFPSPHLSPDLFANLFRVGYLVKQHNDVEALLTLRESNAVPDTKNGLTKPSKFFLNSPGAKFDSFAILSPKLIIIQNKLSSTESRSSPAQTSKQIQLEKNKISGALHDHWFIYTHDGQEVQDGLQLYDIELSHTNHRAFFGMLLARRREQICSNV